MRVTYQSPLNIPGTVHIKITAIYFLIKNYFFASIIRYIYFSEGIQMIAVQTIAVQMIAVGSR